MGLATRSLSAYSQASIMPPDSAAPAPPSAPSKGRVFARRLLSTLTLWTFVIAAIVSGRGTLFFLLLGFLGITAIYEFSHLDRTLPKPYRRLLLALTIAWFATTFTACQLTGLPWSPNIDLAFLALLVLTAFLPSLFAPLAGRATLAAILFTIAAFLYIPWLSSFMTRVLYLPGRDPDGWLRGLPYLVFLIGVTKFTDCGAYLLGSAIGKHKMIPHISPAKTWEGMAGALLAALAAGLGIYFAWATKMPLLTPLSVTLLSLLLGLICVFGDLAESVLKRCLDVKDSGHFLPGIGGSLDLIDSLLFTAPVFYFYLLYASA